MKKSNVQNSIILISFMIVFVMLLSLCLVGEKSIAIAQDCVHNYTGEVFYDENEHWQICTICGHKESMTHILHIHYDDVHHWDSCICGYTTEKIEHTRSTEWKTTDYNHWKSCTCGHAIENGVHTFDNGICTVCGVVEVHYHNYGIEYVGDDIFHWNECECGEKIYIEKHSYQEKCDDTYHWEECTKCYHVYNKTNHEFSTRIFSDESTHWNMCSCGVKTNVEDHTFDDDTNVCVCGAKKPHEHVWVITETVHYIDCPCGQSTNPTQHLLQTFTDEKYHYLGCTCGYLSQKEEHSISTEWQTDERSHWQGCSCGYKVDYASHTFINNYCTECGLLDKYSLPLYYIRVEGGTINGAESIVARSGDTVIVNIDKDDNIIYVGHSRKFEGWEVNGVLVSTERNYHHVVTGSATIRAKYKIIDENDKEPKELTGGKIAGISVACVVFTLSLIGLLVWKVVANSKNKKETTNNNNNEFDIDTNDYTINFDDDSNNDDKT